MIIKYPIVSLILLAIVTGLLWRLEVEYHGWTGLSWISYFHLAIPVGFGLFLLWGNQLLELNLKKRVALNIAVISYGLLLYIGLKTSLTYIFAGGPSGFILVMQTPEWQLNLIRYSFFLLIPFMPIGAYLILRIFKNKPSLRFLTFSVVGIIVSVPFSIIILELINHKGGQDLIHSIKSGIIIPFWVVSFGLLIISQKIKTRKHSKTYT